MWFAVKRCIAASWQCIYTVFLQLSYFSMQIWLWNRAPSPDSPDLAPSNFFLFQNIKNIYGEEISSMMVVTAVENWFALRCADFYKDGINRREKYGVS